MNEVLKNFDVRFDYKSNFDTGKLIRNVSVDNMAFEFKNGDINRPVINGDINLFLELPGVVSDIAVGKIRGVPTLSHQGTDFGKINLRDWHDCENKAFGSLLFVSFKLNQEEIEIVDKAVFGKVIRDVLNKGSSKIFIDAVLDCLLSTLIGEFELKKIHAKSVSDITRDMIW